MHQSGHGRDKNFTAHLGKVLERRWRGSYVLTCTVVCASMLTVACASIKGFPDRTDTTKSEIDAYAAHYKTAPALIAFESTQDGDRGGLSKEGWRNEVIEARIQDVNLHFSDFEKGLYSEGVGYGIGTDWLALALSGAGAIATGGTSQALSAASGGVTGARASYDKEALYSKTLPVLMAQMVAQRNTVLARIRQQESLDANKYPLTRGLADVEDYYQAGTIPGAITQLANSTGSQDKAAQEKLDNIPMVTVVVASFQLDREKVAGYVKSLTPAQVDQLATALAKPTGDTALLGILQAIDATTGPDDLAAIKSKIKTLFNQDL